MSIGLQPVGSAGAWGIAALLVGVVALVLVAAAARKTGRARVGLAGAGLVLGITALLLLTRR